MLLGAGGLALTLQQSQAHRLSPPSYSSVPQSVECRGELFCDPLLVWPFFVMVAAPWVVSAVAHLFGRGRVRQALAGLALVASVVVAAVWMFIGVFRPESWLSVAGCCLLAAATWKRRDRRSG